MSIEMTQTDSLPKLDTAEQSSAARDAQQQTVTQIRDMITEQQVENSRERELNKEELNRAAETFAQVAQTLNKELQFSVNNDLDRTVVKVVDRTSGEVIRQIPSEDLVRVAERLREMTPDKAIDSATGLLIDSQA
ncbi:hypothetical protein CWE09_06670 [Aliidiomarina minuta]|uniref:Flagellar biosynthesis protein FlaG n=1 Tax=Aliidiomarina minuta TaxID=880057 RepID=A0A432W8T1_9GAMM|nr:flagellar protein FlaG [Aliidiomarina minuta]RUO26386.1 hypothetical protein CWE09_06670 [Aliidiomarina minuta]